MLKLRFGFCSMVANSIVCIYIYIYKYIQVISKNIAHGTLSNSPNSVQMIQAPVLRRWKTARVVEPGSKLSE